MLKEGLGLTKQENGLGRKTNLIEGNVEMKKLLPEFLKLRRKKRKIK